MLSKILALILAPLKARPVLFAGAAASAITAVSNLGATHPSTVVWVASAAPIILAFITQFWTVPWAKVKPIFDQAADVTAQVFPATSKWDVVVKAAVDSAAAQAASTGWPAPIAAPAVDPAPAPVDVPAPEAAPAPTA